MTLIIDFSDGSRIELRDPIPYIPNMGERVHNNKDATGIYVVSRKETYYNLLSTGKQDCNIYIKADKL